MPQPLVSDRLDNALSNEDHRACTVIIVAIQLLILQPHAAGPGRFSCLVGGSSKRDPTNCQPFMVRRGPSL